ncbi:MAG: rRNA (guanine527-N7)-methyltransferase [Acidimicrobiaceae bacterium]|jgi:16S rRNA (guanine527-N7)-methyltransferase
MAVLAEAQDIGLIGPGAVRVHLEHALGFAAVLGGCPEGTMLDLGSGAGLPGLVLAAEWPDSRWVLLDSRARSTEFLTGAVERLGMQHRVTVVAARAEVVAHDPAYRGAMRVVTARSVAPPAVVAECAAGFLVEGGTLVVSEPPEPGLPRWDTFGLARLGMGPARLVSASEQVHFSLVDQQSPCPERYPRRTGVPARRPLF